MMGLSKDLNQIEEALVSLLCLLFHCPVRTSNSISSGFFFQCKMCCELSTSLRFSGHPSEDPRACAQPNHGGGAQPVKHGHGHSYGTCQGRIGKSVGKT